MTDLQYRIKDVENAPKDVHLSLPGELIADALSDMEVDLAQSKVVLDAHLSAQARNIQCDGSLAGRLVVTCQRCLGPAVLPLDVRLHTTFAPPTVVSVEDASRVARAGKRPAASDDDAEDFDDAALAASDVDDEDYAHHDGEFVDLAPLVREYVILAVPMTVLCKQDCRGLCPSCGEDLNVKQCACAPAPSLSPLSALKAFKI